MSERSRLTGASTDRCSLYVVLYLMFLYIPSLMLPIFSFNDSVQMVLPLAGFTVAMVRRGFHSDPACSRHLGNSFKLAIPVAIVRRRHLATIAAKALTRYRLPGPTGPQYRIHHAAHGHAGHYPRCRHSRAHACGWRPISSLSLWTDRCGARRDYRAVLDAGYAGRASRASTRVSKNQHRTSGESAWMTFWRVTFPLILPGHWRLPVACHSPTSFDEFLLALFLGGNEMTLPVYMWTQVRFPQTLPSILALGTCIFLGSVLAHDPDRRMAASHGHTDREMTSGG